MTEVSFVRRIWNTIKPPPAVSKPKAPLTASQKKMIRITGSLLAALLLSGGIWYWIASAPERAESRFQTGMRLMSPGKYPAAIDQFSHAVSTWDRHAQAYLQRGNARQILGQFDDALKDFEHAAQIDPSLAEAYTARGTILGDRGDLRGAIAAITRSLGVRPTMDGYYQRGQLWARLGDHKKAIEDFDRAIGEERNAPYVYFARGASRRAIGDQTGYEQDRDLGESIVRKR